MSMIMVRMKLPHTGRCPSCGNSEGFVTDHITWVAVQCTKCNCFSHPTHEQIGIPRQEDCQDDSD